MGEALEDEPIAAITEGTILDYVIERQGEGRSPSTIRNDITALSRVLVFAKVKGWVPVNVAREFDRREHIGHASGILNPPTDAEIADSIAAIKEWSPSTADLVRWLRDTGMRLGEALAVQAEDIHPDGRTVTLRRAVKRGRVRTVDLGKAVGMLCEMPRTGRLFPGLRSSSIYVSSKYGQWCRQEQGREDRLAAAQGRMASKLRRWRLHDLRHAYALASMIDGADVYRLRSHLGHTKTTTTEVYLRYLEGEGSQRKFSRRPDLFGSLPPPEPVPTRRKRA